MRRAWSVALVVLGMLAASSGSARLVAAYECRAQPAPQPGVPAPAAHCEGWDPWRAVALLGVGAAVGGALGQLSRARRATRRA